MNGLLNETVVRVVLMVKVKSPGRTCNADKPGYRPALRSGSEAAFKSYRLSLLSKIAQARKVEWPTRNSERYAANGRPDQFCTVSALVDIYSTGCPMVRTQKDEHIG